MAIDVKFSFICEKQFQELKGDSDKVRFCEKCQYQVFNLDPLTDEERLKLFEDASKNNKKICVATTLAVENQVPCSQRQRPNLPPPITRPTAGLPVMPPPDKLAQERARIEKLKQGQNEKSKQEQTLWERLKFW